MANACKDTYRAANAQHKTCRVISEVWPFWRLVSPQGLTRGSAERSRGKASVSLSSPTVEKAQALPEHSSSHDKLQSDVAVSKEIMAAVSWPQGPQGRRLEQ